MWSRDERTQVAHTVKIGVRYFFETLRQSWCPGTARSRENANIIREADVTEAIVQKHCAIAAMKSRNSAHFLPIDVCQMYCTMKRPAPAAPLSSGTTKVTATRSRKPKITDTTTDITIPQAAPTDACLVSSLMCAEAS